MSYVQRECSYIHTDPRSRRRGLPSTSVESRGLVVKNAPCLVTPSSNVLYMKTAGDFAAAMSGSALQDGH